MVYGTAIGGCTRDAELKYTASGEPILNLSLGTSHRAKKDGQWVDESSYWDVSMFGKRGESLCQYLTKGKQIAVTGEIYQESWEKDGVKHSKCKITADHIDFVGNKSEGKQDSKPAGKPPTNPKPKDNDFENDIPF